MADDKDKKDPYAEGMKAREDALKAAEAPKPEDAPEDHSRDDTAGFFESLTGIAKKRMAEAEDELKAPDMSKETLF